MYIVQYIYLYIYIEKKNAKFCFLLRSFAKERNVLCKRMLRSLRSFLFFAKERSVLLGLISRQKLEKRTEKNVAFFKRTEKNGTFRTEKNAVPNPG